MKPSLWLVLCLSCFFNSQLLAASPPQKLTLTFDGVLQLSSNQDPLRSYFKEQQQAYAATAEAVDQLPDPKATVGLMNVPVDSFNLSQENMTQLQLGLSQMFPRGDTLDLKRQQQLLYANVTDAQALLRQYQVSREVGLSWLNAYYWQQSKAILVANRSLFSQLVDVVNAQFRSGKNKLQDVVQAELELARYDDKIDAAESNRLVALQSLGRYLEQSIDNYKLAANPPAKLNIEQLNAVRLEELLESHPLILIEQQKMNLAQNNVALAEQAYKPQFGINAAYGYRQDSPVNGSRSDFFSVGLVFDIPLFTASRQDNTLAAAKYQQQSVKWQRQDKLAELITESRKHMVELDNLSQRLNRYQTRLQVQAADNARSALDGYTSDYSNFSQVVQAYLLEANTDLQALNIKVELLKAQHQLNFYLGYPHLAKHEDILNHD